MNLRDSELQRASNLTGLSECIMSSVGAINKFVMVRQEVSTASMCSICR